MSIVAFLESNKAELIERWKEAARDRLRLELAASELLDHLPYFLDDLVGSLRSPDAQWTEMRGARSHGQQRMQLGVDIGALTEEMALVGEVLLELAAERRIHFESAEVQRLLHSLGRASAASIRAYAALRDREVLNQAAAHFSLAAHEIRSPLQTAQFATELLLKPSSDDRKRHLDLLKRALLRVSELVDNSIIQARLSGSPRLAVQSVNIEQLVQAVREDVDYLAQAKAITVDTQISAAQIEADYKLLASALLNLLRNAIKFSGPGAHILLRASQREDRVLFTVEDECGGIPEDLPKRLFQPFVQAGSDKSGFGLGLLIVKQATEAHRGSVRVTNRLDRSGCIFVLDLPLHYQHLEEHRGP